ncbi:MAG: DegT/DnrJ/EryC1/StrS family aminotransferase, partial [Pseudomonadota bacterium]
MRSFSVSRSNLPGLLVWVFGWTAMWLLSAQLGLSNLGLILVLTSAIAAIWLSVRITLVVSLIALMAFNWTFVPPLRTFTIDFHQDALLLLAMLVVNIIIASLMASLREKSRQSQEHADAVEALRSWSDRLRDAEDPRDLLPALQTLLAELSGRECALLVLQNGLPSEDLASATVEHGAIDKEQRMKAVDESLCADVGPGNALVTSAITFVATANAALYAGGRAVFTDIDARTINMSPESLEETLVRERDVRAVAPVHFAGLPCDMPAIRAAADRAGAVVIEDASHALGARYPSGERVGSCVYSLMTVFSFHPVKAIAAGEGGMITTNDDRIYRRLLRLRSHGINKL